MTATILRVTRTVSMAIVICLISGVPGAAAQEKARVQGEIVDLPCYMMQGGGGAEYRACVQQYANQAITLGVVTDGGELLLLLNQSADRDPYEAAKKLAGARAQLTGKRVRKQGVASLIVESAEGW